MTDNRDDNEPQTELDSESSTDRVKRISEDTVPRAALLAAFLGSLAFSLLVIFMFVSMKRTTEKELEKEVQEEVYAPLSQYKTIEQDSFGYLSTRGEEVILKDAFVRFIPHIPSIFENEKIGSVTNPTKEIQIALYEHPLSQDDRNLLRRTRLLMLPGGESPVPVLTINLTLPADSLTCDPEAIKKGVVTFNPTHSLFSNITDPSAITFDIVPTVLKRNGNFSTTCGIFENGQPLTFYYRHTGDLPELEQQQFTWNIYFERPLLPLQFLSNIRYQEFAEALALWRPDRTLEVAYFHQPLSESEREKINSSGNFAANKGVHPDAIASMNISDEIDISRTVLNRDMVTGYKVVFYQRGQQQLEMPPGRETLEFAEETSPTALSGLIKEGSTVTSRVQGRIIEHLDEGMYRLEFALPARVPVHIAAK